MSNYAASFTVAECLHFTYEMSCYLHCSTQYYEISQTFLNGVIVLKTDFISQLQPNNLEEYFYQLTYYFMQLFPLELKIENTWSCNKQVHAKHIM